MYLQCMCVLSQKENIFPFCSSIISWQKNFSSRQFKVKQGDRIAQFFLIKLNNCEFIEVRNLSKTFRGEKGFRRVQKPTKREEGDARNLFS